MTVNLTQVFSLLSTNLLSFVLLCLSNKVHSNSNAINSIFLFVIFFLSFHVFPHVVPFSSLSNAYNRACMAWNYVELLVARWCGVGIACWRQLLLLNFLIHAMRSMSYVQATWHTLQWHTTVQTSKGSIAYLALPG
jgi:hypothetical protein